MTLPLDPRTTLALDGLAVRMLEGVIAADRFAPSRECACAAPAAAIRRSPSVSAEQMDQLLFGEGFDVLVEQGGWRFGQARRDGYVGWVEAASLDAAGPAPTHRVSALRAYAFPEPSLKSAPPVLLSMNALVAVDGREGRYLHAAGAGWIADSALTDFTAFETDPAAVAARFAGAPYQWGGRESLGLDCSGLVQQALYACGLGCPRDTDQQASALGSALTEGAPLARNDLVFWKGHVGLMLDAERLLHANAHHMQTAVEPLAEAVARIAAAGHGQPVFRRL